MTTGEAQGSRPVPDPLVLVLLGTDHHAFERLVAWSDRWTGSRVLVQHGQTRPPVRADGRPLLPHAELQALLRTASVVVSHGGPATITEARRAGHLPVVVPRDPARGEHVDTHQQLFSRRMAREGTVHLCEDVGALDVLVRRLLEHPEQQVVDAREDDRRAAAAARRVRAVLDEVVAGGGRRR